MYKLKWIILIRISYYLQINYFLKKNEEINNCHNYDQGSTNEFDELVKQNKEQVEIYNKLTYEWNDLIIETIVKMFQVVNDSSKEDTDTYLQALELFIQPIDNKIKDTLLVNLNKK